MSIDKETVQRIANLAQLDLSNEELKKFTPELSNILSLVAQMEQIDTSEIEQMTHPHDATLVMREDTVTETNRRDQLLKNAPAEKDGLFLVPKVID